MAKNEIPKISDFQYLGLCDGFAMVALQNTELVSAATLNIEKIVIFRRRSNKTAYYNNYSVQIYIYRVISGSCQIVGA